MNKAMFFVTMLLAVVVMLFFGVLNTEIENVNRQNMILQPVSTVDVEAELNVIYNQPINVQPENAEKIGTDVLHQSILEGHCPPPEAIPYFMNYQDPENPGKLCPKVQK